MSFTHSNLVLEIPTPWKTTNVVCIIWTTCIPPTGVTLWRIILHLLLKLPWYFPVSFPGQLSPAYLGGGSSQARSRVCLQMSLHALQGLQLLQAPLIGMSANQAVNLIYIGINLSYSTFNYLQHESCKIFWTIVVSRKTSMVSSNLSSWVQFILK